jgi:hypothetical protein
MTEGDDQTISAQNPEHLSELEISDARNWAAGIPAVMAAFSDILQEPGA